MALVIVGPMVSSNPNRLVVECSGVAEPESIAAELEDGLCFWGAQRRGAGAGSLFGEQG